MVGGGAIDHADWSSWGGGWVGGDHSHPLTPPTRPIRFSWLFRLFSFAGSWSNGVEREAGDEHESKRRIVGERGDDDDDDDEAKSERPRVPWKRIRLPD